MNGMEANWTKKLTALHAPIRISPTPKYYESYYYLVDSIASSSNYTLKTIKEKKEALQTDPYSVEDDWEVPLHWKKDLSEEKLLLDPVKIAFQELEHLQKEKKLVAFQDYEIAAAMLKLAVYPQQNSSSPSYLSQMTYLLSWMDHNPHLSDLIQGKIPTFDEMEEEKGIFLPKNYQDHGAMIGSKAILSFSSPTAASLQEQRIDAIVKGFYDPGFIGVGNRCLLASPSLIHSIARSHQSFSPDGTPTNGIFVWNQSDQEIKKICQEIEERFQKSNISSYWKVESYEEFGFAQELLHQFESDRRLLLLVASIILIVACSNIVSLLVLLVKERRKEIAILQSMGASKKSIGMIFAFCGLFMGTVGSILGSFAAMATLFYIDTLLHFINLFQKTTTLHPAFLQPPHHLSSEALFFVLITTPLLSFVAGLVPAILAAKVEPSSTLRST